MVSSFGYFLFWQSFDVSTVEAAMRRNFSAMKFESRIMLGGNYMIPIRIDTIGECSGCSKPNFEYREADNDAIANPVRGEISGALIKTSESFFISESDLRKPEGVDRFTEHNPSEDLVPATIVQDQSLCNEDVVVGIESGKKMDCFDTLLHEYPEQNISHSLDDDGVCRNNTGKDPLRESNQKNKEVERGSTEGLVNYDKDREKEDVAQRLGPVVYEEEPTKDLDLKKGMRELDLGKNKTVRNMVTRSTYKVAQSSNPKQLLKSSRILKGGQKNDIHSRTQILTESIACNKFDNAPKKIDQRKNDENIIAKHKLKLSRKENVAENISSTSKVRGFCYHI